jgi:hypothetical protein
VDGVRGAGQTGGPAEPVAPGLRLLGRFVVRLGQVYEVGGTQWGRRRIVPITGGEFDGMLRGTVLPGGADWQVVHADGSATIDTRYLLRAENGALITLSTQGCRHGPPDVLAALAHRDDVDPASYYFRLSLRFETGHPEFGWLNRAVAIASAVRAPDRVCYDAYLVT